MPETPSLSFKDMAPRFNAPKSPNTAPVDPNRTFNRDKPTFNSSEPSSATVDPSRTFNNEKKPSFNTPEEPALSTAETTNPLNSAETSRTPEVPTERQRSEIDTVSSNVINRKLDEITSLPPEQQPSALVGLRMITRDYKAGSDYTTAEKPDGLKTSITVMVDGEEVVVSGILRANENSLVCRRVVPDAPADENRRDEIPNEITISRLDLANAQLLDDADAILATLTGPARDIVELRIKALRGEELPETTNDIIRQAAKASSGIHSVDTMQAFVAKNFADLSPEEQQASPQKQRERVQQREQFQQSLEGKNIADPSTVAEIISATGKNPEQYAKDARSLQTKIEETKASLKNPELNKAQKDSLKRQQANAEAELEATEELIKMMESTSLVDMFQAMQTGTVDAATTELMDAAIKSGNVDAVIKQAYPKYVDDPSKTAEENYKKRLAHEHKIDIIKKGGLGAIAALLMAVMGASSLLKD